MGIGMAVLLACCLSGLLYVGLSRLGSRPDKVWKYRYTKVADMERLYNRYQSGRIEVKINDDGTLELGSNSGAPRDSLQGFINYLREHPQCKLWLSLSDLTKEKYRFLSKTFTKLLNDNHLSKEQLIVETDQWDLMYRLTILGFYTATTFEADSPRKLSGHQRDSLITRLSRVAGSGCVSAIVIPGAWYGILRQQFDSLKIDFIIAAPETSQLALMLSSRRKLLDDERVRAVAVK